MLNIDSKNEGGSLSVVLDGRLDTITAPELEKTLNASLDGVTALILDFEKLTYISSAGLRVLLAAQKRMSSQGSMKVMHVSDAVMEIFEVTGFSGILTIQ